MNRKLTAKKAKTSSKKVGKSAKTESILIGNRIPKDYFVTQGKGESDITVHAGSYHLALKDAGIEMYNIMTYSSIMPQIATEIQRPKSIVHGSVVECIMAAATSKKGERATAGIIYGWLYDKKTGKKYGGLVCEHNGHYHPEEIKEKLNMSLDELYYNGFSEQYELKEKRMMVESFTPTKQHGTVLVAICFTSYEYPVLKR